MVQGKYLLLVKIQRNYEFDTPIGHWAGEGSNPCWGILSCYFFSECSNKFLDT